MSITICVKVKKSMRKRIDKEVEYQEITIADFVRTAISKEFDRIDAEKIESILKR